MGWRSLKFASSNSLFLIGSLYVKWKKKKMNSKVLFFIS